MTRPLVHRFQNRTITVGDLELDCAGTWFIESRNDGPQVTIEQAWVESGAGPLEVAVSSIPRLSDHAEEIALAIEIELSQREADEYDPDARGDWLMHVRQDERHARVISGTGNDSEQRELDALCRGLRGDRP
jgi:hypothetical protein